MPKPRVYVPKTEAQKNRQAAQARAKRLFDRLASVPLPPLERTRTDQHGRPLFGEAVTDHEMTLLAETFIHGGQADAAYCLGLSVETVKNHSTRMYSKLGANSATQAAVLLGWMAFPRGLVKPHRKPAPPLEPLPDVERF